MIDADSETLSALARAFDAADREGQLVELVARLTALDNLGPKTCCVLFTDNGCDITFVVFAATMRGFEPILSGPLVVHRDRPHQAAAA
jgi:hypothetical protein